MPALSKKYKINYKKRYTISKNKKQQSRKSIKVYHNRIKQPTRKRKYYMGGDIEVPMINNIFPIGQTYQPNTDCLEKECDKGDAGELTTTCLNTLIIMNLFSQNLDASEETTRGRIDDKLTAEEKEQVDNLTKKYLTNYVDSLFSRSIFSKNNVDLTPENTQKLKELLKVINQEYIDYLINDSNLSDDIKQQVLATQEELNAATAPPDNATAPTSATATAPTTAPAIIDNTAIEAERAKKATDDAEAERLRLEAEKKAAEDAAAAKKAVDDAETERVRLEQENMALANEVEAAKSTAERTKEAAINLANQTKENAINLAKQTRIAAVEAANQELDKNIQEGKLSEIRYNFLHNNALRKAERAEKTAITKATKAEEKAIANAGIAEKEAVNATNRKIAAKQNLASSQIPNNP
jgi:hypothetical protein